MPLRHFAAATLNSHSASPPPLTRIQRIRNIGIIAHIDAGKTTTTERLLYYAGSTHSIGDVDAGSTVTDYLPEERERGITIQSAAVTLQWSPTLQSSSAATPYRINLIDTPGHVDFQIEVESSVRVLDGAVAVVDAVKGVEAQTETVWRQADRYNVARIVYINKMDRVGADYEYALSTLTARLQCSALPLQLPLFSNPSDQSTFYGVVDLLHMLVLEWPTSNIMKDSGRQYSSMSLTPEHPQYSEATAAREKLVEQIAELDDTLMETYLDDAAAITNQQLHAAVRRITTARKAVPVLYGASLRNIAVQPLLDAICMYLPSPSDLPPFTATLLHDHKHKPHAHPTVQRSADDKQPLTALAFKVTHDIHRGLQPVVYVRVYSGVLRERDQLLNTWQTLRSHHKHLATADSTITPNVSKQLAAADVKERVQRILAIQADQTTELKQLETGNIAALIGLKHTRTGDTLVLAADKQPVYLQGINPPEPVFMCSVEASSVATQTALDAALQAVQREDPSFRVTTDNETGQTLISGMGELHIEVIYHRLKRDFKVDAELGKMRVAYRETAGNEASVSYKYSQILSSRNQTPASATNNNDIQLTLQIQPRPTGTGNAIVFDSHCDAPDEATVTAQRMTAEMRAAVESGIEDGFSRGPLLGYNVVDVAVTVQRVVYTTNAAPIAGFRATAARCLALALQQADPQLLEPVMHTILTINNDNVGDVLSDLTSRRRAMIRSVDVVHHAGTDTNSGRQLLDAEVPLSEMIGYATALRSRTAGTGTYSMEFLAMRPVGSQLQQQLLASPP